MQHKISRYGQKNSVFGIDTSNIFPRIFFVGHFESLFLNFYVVHNQPQFSILGLCTVHSVHSVDSTGWRLRLIQPSFLPLHTTQPHLLTMTILGEDVSFNASHKEFVAPLARGGNSFIWGDILNVLYSLRVLDQ